jgi:hypothetical protein
MKHRIHHRKAFLRDILTLRIGTVYNVLHIVAYISLWRPGRKTDITQYVLHSHHSAACRSCTAQSLIITRNVPCIILVENNGPQWQSFHSRHQLIIHLINKGTKVRRESNVVLTSSKLCAYVLSAAGIWPDLEWRSSDMETCIFLCVYIHSSMAVQPFCWALASSLVSYMCVCVCGCGFVCIYNLFYLQDCARC